MRVAILGAGPAGMSAGISACGQGHEVTVFERNDIPGRKLLMTGNGRCNITNRDCGITDNYTGLDREKIRCILDRFDLETMRRFLSDAGIYIRSRDGYYYPASDQAVTVRDAFFRRLCSLGANVRTGIKVTGIIPLEGGFRLNLGYKDGSMATEDFDACIICGGGRACPSTGSDGFVYKLCKKLDIEVIKPFPALTKLYFSDEEKSVLEGVRAVGRLTLFIDGAMAATQSGNIQFLKNAVSGIPAFQLSLTAARELDRGAKIYVIADLFSEATEAELAKLIFSRRHLFGSVPVREGLVTLFNDRVALLLSGMLPENREAFSHITREDSAYLAHLAKNLRFDITRAGDYSESQASSGGIDMSQLTTELEFIKYPGLFAAGECLDCTGLCGGFNLHFAIASGALAGRLGCATRNKHGRQAGTRYAE